MFSLSAKKSALILSKMPPKKAANLTEKLKKGPPF
jgi:flagellar motility protein MotE (MotC chaperone)